MNGRRARGVCGVTAGSPPGHAPPFTQRQQRLRRAQAGGGSGVWLLRSRELSIAWGRGGTGLHRGLGQRRRGAASSTQPAIREPGGRLAPSPTRHRRPRFATKPGCGSAEPHAPQRVAKTSLPYRRPIPGVREHSPLRTAGGRGLRQKHPANTPQLAWRRRRNGSDDGARGAGSVRVRMRTKRV